MDPNFQSRYLESTDEPAEAVDPLAESEYAADAHPRRAGRVDPADIAPEDRTEEVPAITAPGTAASPRRRRRGRPLAPDPGRCPPAQPAAASRHGGLACHGATLSRDRTRRCGPSGIGRPAGRWFRPARRSSPVAPLLRVEDGQPARCRRKWLAQDRLRRKRQAGQPRCRARRTRAAPTSTRSPPTFPATAPSPWCR